MKQFKASKVIDSWGGCYVLVATNDRLRRGTDERQGMRAFHVRGQYSHLTYPLVNRLGRRFPLRARCGWVFAATISTTSDGMLQPHLIAPCLLNRSVYSTWSSSNYLVPVPLSLSQCSRVIGAFATAHRPAWPDLEPTSISSAASSLKKQATR